MENSFIIKNPEAFAGAPKGLVDYMNEADIRGEIVAIVPGVRHHYTRYDNAAPTAPSGYKVGYDADWNTPEDEHESALSYDGYLQDAYNNENMSLIESLEEAAGSLGMRIADRNHGAWLPKHDQFATDREIVHIAENDFLQIGWRSWETDFVVAIAGADERFGDMEANGNDMLECYGLPLAVSSSKYEELQSLAEKYVVHFLQIHGFNCRYKTSGYTTSSYDKPDNLSGEIASLKNQIQERLEYLQNHREAGLHKAVLDAELRPALLRDIYEHHDSCSSINLRIPYADLDEENIILVDAFRIETVANRVLPDDLRDHLRQRGVVSGVVALARDADTESYFAGMQADYQKRGQLDLLVSEEEFKLVNPDYECEFDEESDPGHLNGMAT